MKKLITTLTFLLMFSSPSYAEWTKMGENTEGTIFYLDFDRIRKVDGSVYYWVLGDFLKPNQYGDFSYQDYKQGDCKLFRSKRLSVTVYTQPMGKGTSATSNIPKEWVYPPPDSVGEYLLNAVCNR